MCEDRGARNLAIALRWDHFKEPGDQFNVTVFNLAEILMITELFYSHIQQRFSSHKKFQAY